MGDGCSRRMRTALASLASLAIALASAWSTTATATTGLLPVDASAMGADAARLRRGVTDAARDVLKGNAVDVIDAALPGGLARCSADAACMRGVVERLGTDDLAAFVAVPGAAGSPAGAWATVSVTIYNQDGVASFRSSQPLSTATDLMTLMVRTFDPQHHTGRLDVVGLVDGDVVLVDGLLAAPTSLVRAGPHTVMVVHGDGTTTTSTVDVGYDERHVLPVTRPQEDSAGSWPILVGGVVGGVGVVGAVVGGVVAGTAGEASGDRGTLGVVGAVVGSAMAVAGLTVVAATLLSSSSETLDGPAGTSGPTTKAQTP